MELTHALQPSDLAAFDRVCRRQGISRVEAVEIALRWYIERDGDLPTIDFDDDPDVD